MSCGTTQDDENPPMPLAPAAAILCTKCSAPSIIQIRMNGYCNDCFLQAFNSKYKQGMNPALRRSRYGSDRQRKLGKRGNVKRSSILVAFSGGPASMALLEMVKRFTKEKERDPRDRSAPNYTAIEVAYVDETGVPGAVDHTEEARALVEAAGLIFVPLKLSSIFDSPALSTSLSSTSLPLSFDKSAPTSLSALFASLSPTSLASLRSSLVQSLLRRTAVARNHEILLTGETATRVAIKVIAGMAEGRGFALGEEVGAEFEAEEGKVTVVRPFSLALQMEVNLFLELAELKGKGWEDGSAGKEEARQAGDRDVKKKGIERLTEDFVLGLEENFPSTVSTIIRTAGKLGLRTSHADVNEEAETLCPLCGLTAQFGASEWRKAVTVSSLEPFRGVQPIASTEVTTPLNNTTYDARIPLSSLLCYGCLLILDGLQQQDAARNGGVGEILLPAYVGDAARDRWALEKPTEVRARSEAETDAVVKEFLID
ncbi:cytoplasmic tRNA 2-thiolation protein 2, partial [Phenoliferia sp. Uapishka_3]